MADDRLLTVKELRTLFNTPNGQLASVDGVSFAINKGEIVGIVGESGCGKSVTAQSVLRLFDEKREVEYEGEICMEDINLLQLSRKEMQKIRGNDISMVFQDPLSSLNPVYTVGDQIAETLRLHQKVSRKEAHSRAIELLRLTGIASPEERVRQYPHQLSGGMRQRVMIAIALACQPKLLIADEPTTALDVTIQAQIMGLIVKLSKQMNMGVMLITHDLGVVAETCQRVVVMYLGQVVESANVRDLFANPKHPYTKGLLKPVPRIDGDRTQEMFVIQGNVPSIHNVPQGCRFASRCVYADDKCRNEMPGLTRDPNDGSYYRCWHAERIREGGA